MITKNRMKEEIRFLQGLEEDAAERLAAAIREQERAERQICLLQANIAEWRKLLEGGSE